MLVARPTSSVLTTIFDMYAISKETTHDRNIISSICLKNLNNSEVFTRFAACEARLSYISDVKCDNVPAATFLALEC